MLYHYLYALKEQYAVFNVFKYISFRSSLAFVLSAILSIIIGKYFIRFMSKKQFGQIVRDDGPSSHLKKQGTPTMGGVFIIFSIFFALLFTGNFLGASMKAFAFVTMSYFLLGFLDDYLKVLKKNTAGVSGKMKLLWQFITSGLVMWWLIAHQSFSTEVFVPFYKHAVIDIGYWYILLGSIVIVGSSNAVNLTDGLDGLAIGPIMTSAVTLGILSYISGHSEIAEYLFVPNISHVGELTVAMAAIVGAGIGFLWYNSYPAQVFMGDVGSLSLGGAIGLTSLMSKNEFLLVIFGGVFVLEAISVIIQVGSYKTRRKRVFKMAPIHHHFELSGWPETKVIVRFWIISLLLGIISIATLKMR